MKIKKSHLLKGKRYIVIIDVEKEIVEEKVYPATFKEVHVADKIPKWFADWEKANSSKPPQWFTSWTTSFEKKNDERWEQQEKFNKKNDERWEQQESFNRNQENFNQNIGQDIKDIKKDIQLMKNTPTMKLELKQDN